MDSLTNLGFIGIILAFLVEIIPSEIALAYAGYLVYTGKLTFVEAVIAGVVGGALQQLILYAIGRFAGRTFIERYGRYFGIKPSVLAVADRMFEKYGTPIVFFARFIPFVRQGISIPAGMTKMSLWKFNIYTGIASIPWSIIFILAGKKLGENWRDVVNNEHTPWFVGFALLGIVLVCGFLYLRNRQKRKQA